MKHRTLITGIILTVLTLCFASASLADTTMPIYSNKTLTVTAHDSQGNIITPSPAVTFDTVGSEFCTVSPAQGSSTQVSSGARAGDCSILIKDGSGVVQTEVVHVVAGPVAGYTATWGQ